MEEHVLKSLWQHEEDVAHIHGWDFSHIAGRYEEEGDLPWDYRQAALEGLRPDMDLLDYDTGGGEFLLSLGHPHERTWATEGYPPNAALCRERLEPLGVHFQTCDNPAAIPFGDAAFDRILNRHGDFCPSELYRLLKPGGLAVTEQVGGQNDRDLVELVLPGTPPPYPHLNLEEQRRAFEAAGFRILRAQEAFRPIRFYDVGAFVWFARILPWEFPGFSLERCFPALLDLHRTIQREGQFTGTIHRFLLAAEKPTCSAP